ncbi:hypothetical protein TNIN_237461 [Trichonephila inaurata madagascariensis]|uniref:Uncharacterized protein n=1 Tax=Trichonephila inaurata madagascariensis TaxID=2747483 RepID=A0A8X6WRU3_9ARAC|nr:hypothetical protein TNIN_237461 [Trichonephila inaurata madagascariensis]
MRSICLNTHSTARTCELLARRCRKILHFLPSSSVTMHLCWENQNLLALNFGFTSTKSWMKVPSRTGRTTSLMGCKKTPSQIFCSISFTHGVIQKNVIHTVLSIART